jgi:hypothetical protein
MLFTESQRGKLLEAQEAFCLGLSLMDDVVAEGFSTHLGMLDVWQHCRAAGEDARDAVACLLDPETEAELRGEL